MQEILVIYACITAFVWVAGGLIVYTQRDTPPISSAIDRLLGTIQLGQEKYKKQFGWVLGFFLFDLLLLGIVVFWPCIIFKKH